MPFRSKREIPIDDERENAFRESGAFSGGRSDAYAPDLSLCAADLPRWRFSSSRAARFLTAFFDRCIVGCDAGGYRLESVLGQGRYGTSFLGVRRTRRYRGRHQKNRSSGIGERSRGRVDGVRRAFPARPSGNRALARNREWAVATCGSSLRSCVFAAACGFLRHRPIEMSGNIPAPPSSRGARLFHGRHRVHRSLAYRDGVSLRFARGYPRRYPAGKRSLDEQGRVSLVDFGLARFSTCPSRKARPSPMRPMTWTASSKRCCFCCIPIVPGFVPTGAAALGSKNSP